MTWIRAVRVAIWLSAVVTSTAARAAVTVERIQYHGWRDALRMTNGTVELIVVPQIGRIMRYGFVDGPNVLWENTELAGKPRTSSSAPTDWMNYGGDKLWNAPQSKSGWPPDPVLDGGACTVTLRPDGHLRIDGQRSPGSGLRFERDIELAENGTAVTLRNILMNEGTQPANWAIWEVAQVDDPKQVRVPRSRSARFHDGYHVFADFHLQPGMLVLTTREIGLRRDSTHNAKIGTDAPEGWIKGDVAGHEFTLSAQLRPGLLYPDEGCSEQLYVNEDPLKYAEMEILGPLREIPAGKSTSFVTHWKLARKAR